MKAAEYGKYTNVSTAFVSTNSICQGRQVEGLWSLIYKENHQIFFAHTSFKWQNLASHNAGVTVIIVGISNRANKERRLFSVDDNNETIEKKANNINPYLIASNTVIVKPHSKPISDIYEMSFGNMANDGGGLLFEASETNEQ